MVLYLWKHSLFSRTSHKTGGWVVYFAPMVHITAPSPTKYFATVTHLFHHLLLSLSYQLCASVCIAAFNKYHPANDRFVLLFLWKITREHSMLRWTQGWVWRSIHWADISKMARLPSYSTDTTDARCSPGPRLWTEYNTVCLAMEELMSPEYHDTRLTVTPCGLGYKLSSSICLSWVGRPNCSFWA